METTHRVNFTTAAVLNGIQSESIDLVVTSPPYPMIEMWDTVFCGLDPSIDSALGLGDGTTAFDLMHRQLEPVWRECFRVLKPGSFLCLNIGDATRTLGGMFRLYTNHSRLDSFCEFIGFSSLPPVIWRKQTNAPTKFMGSGMLPAGAYVTLEHEYILVFRKGDKRAFLPADRERRRESACFWEERNIWFSDIWEIRGSRQELVKQPGGDDRRSEDRQRDDRRRSAAFPLEIAVRLVLMYSLQGDTVLDPFLGTGTTSAACILNGRNSVGFEISSSFGEVIRETMKGAASSADGYVSARLERHRSAAADLEGRNRPLRYRNDRYGFPVMTAQETGIRLPVVSGIRFPGEPFAVVEYSQHE